jgi:hypothetical protein
MIEKNGRSQEGTTKCELFRLETPRAYSRFIEMRVGTAAE